MAFLLSACGPAHGPPPAPPPAHGLSGTQGQWAWQLPTQPPRQWRTAATQLDKDHALSPREWTPHARLFPCSPISAGSPNSHSPQLEITASPAGGGLLLQLLSQAGIPGWGPRDYRPARELTGERQVSAPGTPPGRERRPARPGAPSEEEQPALGARMWPCTATPWTARVDAGASSEAHRRCRWPRAPGSWERPSRHRAQSGRGRASPIPPLCPPRRAGGRPCGLLERAPRLAVAGRDGAAATRPLRGLASPGDGFFRPPRPADFSFKYT